MPQIAELARARRRRVAGLAAIGRGLAAAPSSAQWRPRNRCVHRPARVMCAAWTIAGRPASKTGRTADGDCMLYDAYEMQRSLLAGASALANIGAELAQQSRQSASLISAWGRSSPRALDVFAHAAAPRGKPEFGLDSTVVDGKERRGHRGDRAAASRSASSSTSARGRRGRPEAADRRADVGPLCHAAARHGRADAAERTTSTSPTGATRSWCRWPTAASISTIISII